VALTKGSNGSAQINRHLCRRDHFKSDPPFCQIAKKVIGIAAVVMDGNRMISLLRQGLSESRDQSVVFVRHGNSLNCG
jgi:hypothetical protein